ncbi:MAG: PP2C family protein-serine/threonine phosphatase [Pyrinomonadaceae bacterium]
MMIVEAHATSHVGRVRKGNEDNFLLLDVAGSQSWTSSQAPDALIIESQRFEIEDDNGIILAVSDGMGGALAGEVASKMAVETVSDLIIGGDDPEKTMSPEHDKDTLIEKLFEATVYANRCIHEHGREPEYQGMGATFTGAALTNEGIFLIQVGDSRVYLIRDVNIYQVTKDQSLVQQLIDSGQISADEAESHPLKNVILQALGAQNEIIPVAAQFEPNKDDILVICSDGLSNKIGGADLQRIVYENSENLKMACAELIKEANARGGEDNITVILAKVFGDNLPEATDQDVELRMVFMQDIHDTADQELNEQDTAEID